MKTELIGSVGTGIMAAAAAFLSQYGITPAGVIMAMMGAAIATFEMDGRRWPSMLAIAIFNTIVGGLAGPIIVVAAGVQFGLQAPAIVLVASFVAGYLAHDAFGFLREIIAARAERWSNRK